MLQCVETVLSFFTLAHRYPRRVPSADVKDTAPKPTVSTKRAALIMTDARKITTLELQGNFEEGNPIYNIH